MSLNCPSCGATAKADDRYCGECGRKLADGPVNAADTPTFTAVSERASGQKSSFAIVGLIVVGVVLIGAGTYQVVRRNVAEPQQSVSTPRPAPAQPMLPAPSTAPKRKEAVRTPPPQPEHGCGSLAAPGETLVCDAFEPSWSIAFRCERSRLTTSFTDFFSSAELLKTPGTATLQSRDPWTFRTSQGLAGTIAATPSGCLDDGGQTSNFTLTPKVIPGLDKPETICCRIAR